jgi:hypothetical protein
MKKIYTMIVLAIAALSSGCERELMSYEGVEGIYFAVQSGRVEGSEGGWPYSPYTNVDFVKIVDDTYTVNVKVMATGELKNYDRAFRLAVSPDSTTATAGADYEAIPAEVVMPAGSLITRVPVVLHRTATMATGTVALALKLEENEHFQLTFPNWGPPRDLTDGPVYEGFDASRHIIRVNDILVQPANWTGGFDQYAADNPEFNMLGAFTRKKFLLLSELTGYVYIDFMTDPPMSFGLQSVLGRRLTNYLIAEYKARRAVIEDDGRLMWSEGCPWKSYENVAWDGVYVDYWQ